MLLPINIRKWSKHYSHLQNSISFSSSCQCYVLEALKKVYERNEDFTESALKLELDVTDAMWARLGQDIMKFIFGIPNLYSPKYTRMSGN
jgi:hypothetical protein